MSVAPHLSLTGDDARAEAVVLLLHGGAADSFARVRAFDHAVLRLIPFGHSVVRAGRDRIALARLRFSVRGWNGKHESPVPEAQWALDRIAERFGPLPVGLVGHSMGGRVALRVADHQAVRSVAALAPWLPPGEPLPTMKDRAVLLAHGSADRTTDPGKTAALAEKLAVDGVAVEFKMFPDASHSMLFPARPWHDLVARFMVRSLLTPAPEDAAAGSRS